MMRAAILCVDLPLCRLQYFNPPMASREKNSSDSSESHKAHTAEINGDSNNCADKRVNGSGKHFGLFIFRPHDDDEEQDWWFASTAIPWVLLSSVKAV